MKWFIASLSSLALWIAPVGAQCYETNLGALLGVGTTPSGAGDDVLFALQPMNFAFPMGGVAASYTHIQVNTNGACFLSNGAAPVGATATGHSSSAATVLSNFRGAAGATQAPRIAAYWKDIDTWDASVPANAGVFLNSSIPGKCVVTWRNTRHWGTPSPTFTVQLQLYATGEVVVYHSGGWQNPSTCPLVGVSQGAAIAAPPSTDLSAGAVGVSTSKIVYQTFTAANSVDLQDRIVSFQPNAGGGYDTFPSVCAPAVNVAYGSGCGGQFASFYEYTIPSTGFDLSNRSITMTRTGNSYGVAASTRAFVAPSGSATNLALGDDAEATVGLTSQFPHPGGSANSLTVCSNGFVSTGSNGTSFEPSPATFLGWSETAWAVWHDFVTVGGGGGGDIWSDEAGGIVYVTWLDVLSYHGGSPGVTPSTFQLQFELATGNVHFVFLNMDAVSISSQPGGDGYVVGYSPGGANLDPGSIDLSTALPIATVAADFGHLALGVAPAPVLGSVLTCTASNIPPTAVLSALILSLGQVFPGINLGFAGAPNCFQLVDLSVSSTLLLSGAPTAATALTLPTDPSYIGLPLNSQSASLVPGLNPLGVITSNGVRSVVRSF